MVDLLPCKQFSAGCCLELVVLVKVTVLPIAWFHMQIISDNVLDWSWDLESIGIQDKSILSIDPVLSNFRSNIKCVDDRYQVSLPWKPGGGDTLLNNERLARKWLHNLGKRLDSKTDLKREYNDALKSMETSGVIEEVPHDNVSYYLIYYMPHRPVVKESSITR